MELFASLAAAALVLPQLPAPAGSVEYFGWYGGGWLDGVTAPHSNLYQASSPADAVLAKSKGQQSLLDVQSLFPGLFTATPDFKTKWLPAVPELAALLANETIFGFALGDELVWGGVRPAHLVEYANTVRAAFPRGTTGTGAVIWSNEACFFSGPRAGWKNAKKQDVSDYTIPAALDWFSIDQYHMNGPVKGWPQAHVKVWCGHEQGAPRRRCSLRNRSLSLIIHPIMHPWIGCQHCRYETNIYPNLTTDQRVMLVPGAVSADAFSICVCCFLF